MIEIDSTIVSFDVLEKHFLCDVQQCKGICCVDGESGAPLDKDELAQLEKYYKNYEPWLNEKAKAVIKEKGCYEIDEDGDYVTPLVDGKECVYAFFEDGIAKCAIEKAWEKHKIPYRKPISCHLYPIRISEYETFDALNYDTLHTCKTARENGETKAVPVYVFLKEPLIRKYGEEWYAKLQHFAEKYLSVYKTS